MDGDNKEKIYNTTQVNMLLGCLLKDTSLISNDKYPLCKDDFVGFAFDKVMYVAADKYFWRGRSNKTD